MPIDARPPFAWRDDVLGILSIGGFDWREFVRYAAVITVYVSAVVLSLVLVF